MSIWQWLTDRTDLCLCQINVVGNHIVVEDVTSKVVCRVLVVVTLLARSLGGSKL